MISKKWEIERDGGGGVVMKQKKEEDREWSEIRRMQVRERNQR